MRNYRVGYVDIDGCTKTVVVKAHGIQQAVHRFFDDYSPVMEVWLVAKDPE